VYPAPPTSPGALTIATIGMLPIFSEGTAAVEVTTTKSCPDGMGGVTTSSTGTFMQNFPFMEIQQETPTGSLETLADGSIHGTVDLIPGPSGPGPLIVDWTLSKR